MGYTIAIAGKGGTGKTTITSLLVRLLKERGKGSVLAIDADPNSNLSEALGVKVKAPVGDILDAGAAQPARIPAGMSKDRFIEYRVHNAIVEAEGFDLLTMGRPEGPGCYCYVNNVLRNIMVSLVRDYDYVLIDNEAGLEHLSRRTTRAADALLIVSDATAVGYKSAVRISGLVRELGIKVKKSILIVNRCDNGIDESRAKAVGAQLAGSLPIDENISLLSIDGSSLFELDNDAKSLQALRRLGEKIWN